MRNERKNQRRSNSGRKNRNNDGFGRRNLFLTMDKGIQARAKEPEMNRVSECKEKSKKVAVGSIWKKSSGKYIMWTGDNSVELDTGRLGGPWRGLNPTDYGDHYTQVFCVTIERDPDEQ